MPPERTAAQLFGELQASLQHSPAELQLPTLSQDEVARVHAARQLGGNAHEDADEVLDEDEVLAQVRSVPLTRPSRTT